MNCHELLQPIPKTRQANIVQPPPIPAHFSGFHVPPLQFARRYRPLESDVKAERPGEQIDRIGVPPPLELPRRALAYHRHDPVPLVLLQASGGVVYDLVRDLRPPEPGRELAGNGDRAPALARAGVGHGLLPIEVNPLLAEEDAGVYHVDDRRHGVGDDDDGVSRDGRIRGRSGRGGGRRRRPPALARRRKGGWRGGRGGPFCVREWVGLVLDDSPGSLCEASVRITLTGLGQDL